MLKAFILSFVLLATPLFAMDDIADAKLKSLKFNFKDEITKTDSSIETSKKELRQIMSGRTIDETKVSALIDNISALEKKKLSAKYRFLRDAKTILNDKELKSQDIEKISEL